MLAGVFRADLSLQVEEKNSPCYTKVRNCATLRSQIKEKLNKPNPALTMAADNDPTNRGLLMKRLCKSPHYSRTKKYFRVSTQPTVCQSLAADCKMSEDKENSLLKLPAAKHVPQRNKPAETSVVIIEIN